MGDANERAGDSRSRGWLTFAIGIAVGVAVSAFVVAGALAQQRRARRVLPWHRQRVGRSAPPRDEERMSAARHWPDDAELDEELDQTFPASDPLPYSHRVD